MLGLKLSHFSKRGPWSHGKVLISLVSADYLVRKHNALGNTNTYPVSIVYERQSDDNHLKKTFSSKVLSARKQRYKIKAPFIRVMGAWVPFIG